MPTLIGFLLVIVFFHTSEVAIVACYNTEELSWSSTLLYLSILICGLPQVSKTQAVEFMLYSIAHNMAVLPGHGSRCAGVPAAGMAPWSYTILQPRFSIGIVHGTGRRSSTQGSHGA